MAKYCMLTTTDNPWDPNEDFEAWLAYDNAQGYGTCQYLDRVTSKYNEDGDEEAIIELAIDEIIENDPLGLYVKKVYETEEETE